MPRQMILKSIDMGEEIKPFVRKKHPHALKGCKLSSEEEEGNISVFSCL